MPQAVAVVAVAAVSMIAQSRSNSAQKDANKNSVLTEYQTQYDQNMISGRATLAAASAQAGATRQQGKLEQGLWYQEADTTRSIAKQNIKLMKEEEKESLRRMTYETEQVEDKSKALVAASGVRMEGSPLVYHKELEAENKRQTDWLAKSWNSKIKIANKESDSMYNLYRAKGDVAYQSSILSANALMQSAHIQANANFEIANLYKQKIDDISKPPAVPSSPYTGFGSQASSQAAIDER